MKEKESKIREKKNKRNLGKPKNLYLLPQRINTGKMDT